MNTETQELLSACRDAGYTHISIGIRHKTVPSSLKIEWYGQSKHGVGPSQGQYTGAEPRRDLSGKQVAWNQRPRVICAHPNQRATGRPAIWDICEKSDLTAGLFCGGAGCCETHAIRSDHPLELGVYELTGDQWIRTVDDKWTTYN